MADRAGEILLGFSVSGATTETALLFGELYRRAGLWRFRAIGQGYDSGLGGLATDFGIDVDDTPAEAPEPEAALASDGPIPPARAGAVPRHGPPTAPTTPARRPRTAKKKVVLPKIAAKPALAENENWHHARLFPASSLKNDREREMRATSVLLAVMAHVPEFGRRLTAPFGSPAGRLETFTEVVLPHGDTPRRPDGVIRVERAGKLWTALLETKTNGNRLNADQVQDYDCSIWTLRRRCEPLSGGCVRVCGCSRSW